MLEPRTLTVEPFGEILSERPAAMPFKEYKAKMVSQKHRLRSRLRGFLLRPEKGVGTTVKIEAKQ